jgi:hypothetical protein
MKRGMWEFFEDITKDFDVPIKINDGDSWCSFYDLYPKHGMLMQHWGIGHAPFLWDLSKNMKVVDIFSTL